MKTSSNILAEIKLEYRKQQLSALELERKVIEYAEMHRKEQLTLTDVSQQRELLEAYQHFIDWNEEHDRKASTSERIEAFIASNCG